MASAIKITLAVERDGAPLPGFPLVRRLSVDEVQIAEAEQPTSASYVAFPSSLLDTIQAFIFRADQATQVRFNNQSDAGIPLNANGIIVIIDANINSGATTNSTIQNNSGVTANFKGIAAGT